MDSQDTIFNYKLIVAALIAVIIAILIAFYYSYAQSRNQLGFLEDEKKLLVKDLTLMKAEVDRLSGLNEVNDIELQTSKFRIQSLLDSVGQLNFNIIKLKEDRKMLRFLEAQFDSLRETNDYLKNDNSELAQKYERTLQQMNALRGRTGTLAQAEAMARKKSLELAEELKTKSYLKMDNSEGSGFRLRSGRAIKSTKASVVEKLRGCATVQGNPNESNEIKIIYLQFLSPEMTIIEDNAKVVSVGGNTYSKRVEVVYLGKEVSFCDAISVPPGSLEPGIYTLNIFENQRLLASSEFQLK